MFTANQHRRPMLTLTTFKSMQPSPNLFDFETPINQDNFIINDTSLVYRKKIHDELRFKNLVVVSKDKAMNGDMPDFEFEKLFSLKVQDKQRCFGYTLEEYQQDERPEGNFSIDELQKLPFICLNNNGRTHEVKSTIIRQGDYIKLGKSFFKVAETHLNRHSAHPHLPEQSQAPRLNNFSNNLQNRQAKTCRICLMEDNEDMISPCKCIGSCQFVHIECLMVWLQSKVTKQNNRLVSTYNLSKFECELCKNPLPNKIQVQNREVSFVEFVKPDEPYLILEKLEPNPRDRTLYVITPKDLMVRMGRVHTSDIRMNDPTTSRLHCQIQFRNGQFHLWDMGSRFGTLVLLQQSQTFTRSLSIQLLNKVYKMESVPSIHPRAYNYL